MIKIIQIVLSVILVVMLLVGCGEIKKAINEARNSIENNRPEIAIDNYTKALEINSNNSAAKTGLENAAKLTMDKANYEYSHLRFDNAKKLYSKVSNSENSLKNNAIEQEKKIENALVFQSYLSEVGQIIRSIDRCNTDFWDYNNRINSHSGTDVVLSVNTIESKAKNEIYPQMINFQEQLHSSILNFKQPDFVNANKYALGYINNIIQGTKMIADSQETSANKDIFLNFSKDSVNNFQNFQSEIQKIALHLDLRVNSNSFYLESR